MPSGGFKQYLEQRKLSPSSIEGYLYIYQIFISWLAAETTDTTGFCYNDLLDFIRHLSANGKSKKLINHYLSIIRHYCNYLIKEGKRNDNPAAGIYIKGIVRKLPNNLLTMEEMEFLFSQYKIQLHETINRKIMFGLLIYQGITTDEIVRLKKEDVKLNEGKVFIRGTRKTNERLLTLHASQITMLQAYLQANKAQQGQLIRRAVKVSPHGGDLEGAAHYIRNQMAQMFRQLRLLDHKIINSLQVRSSVITLWLTQHSLRQVQYMAGHKYVSSTERYQINNLQDLQNEINKHHPASPTPPREGLNTNSQYSV